MKTIVLLSGGLDSCVMAAIAQKKGEVVALSFNYQQRHNYELEAAKLIADHLSIQHHIIPLIKKCWVFLQLTSLHVILFF